MNMAQLVAMLLGLTQTGVQVYGELNEEKKREAVIVSRILGQMFNKLPEWVELAKRAKDKELTIEDLVGTSIEERRAEVEARRGTGPE